jgi:hypothetical protein
MIADGCGWFFIEKHVEMKFLTNCFVSWGLFFYFSRVVWLQEKRPNKGNNRRDIKGNIQAVGRRTF